MIDKNLHSRIKNARFMGRQYRLNGESIENNPFAKYQGIDGDGVLIRQAFIEGWRERDKELTALYKERDALKRENAWLRKAERINKSPGSTSMRQRFTSIAIS